MVRQKVLDPEAYGLGESLVYEFGDQSAGDESIEGRAKLNEEHPHIAPLVFEVGQSSGDGILSRPICSVDKLVQVEGGRGAGFRLVLRDQSLKTLYEAWCESDWAVVIRALAFLVVG